MSNNLILLRHLTEIASTKRVVDGNKPKENFPHLYEQILYFSRNQLQKMAQNPQSKQQSIKEDQEEESEDKLRFFVNYL